MTLDEAIQHFEEEAETQRKLYESIKDVWEIDNQEACLECAKDNEQLADWLKQLRQIETAYKTCELYNLIEACMNIWEE